MKNTLEELKNRVLEKTDLVFIITDPAQSDNPIIYANQGFTNLTGYTNEEVVGKNCRFLQGEETDPETVEKLKSSIKSKEAVSVEILNYKKDGSSFWNLLHIDPIYFEEEDQHYFVGIQKDVSAFKKTELQLKEYTEEIKKLSTPIVPITEDVAVLPLIGNIHQQRIDMIVSQVIPQLEKDELEILILDLSGLINVDEEAMSGLFQLSDILKLKGVKLIITGISPKIALKTKDLNLDLSSLVTCGSVRQAIEEIL